MPIPPPTELGESQTPVIRLGIEKNIYSQQAFLSLDILAEQFGISGNEFRTFTRGVAIELTKTVKRLKRDQLGEERLDNCALTVWAINTPLSDLTEGLKGHYEIVRLLQSGTIRSRMKELKIDKTKCEEMIKVLIDQLTPSAPVWMIYLAQYKDFYKTDGTPNNITLRKPEDYAMTYSSWVQWCQEGETTRDARSRSVSTFADQLALNEIAPGFAVSPHKPIGKRRVNVLWHQRRAANTTKDDR